MNKEKEIDVLSNAATGCANSILLLFAAAAILSILKLCNVLDITWLEATIPVWLPVACVVLALAITGAMVVLGFTAYVIFGGVCLIIDKIRSWF
jgi:hypothetical protein